ncbi:MAG: TolC family protein, partial [Phaeodactylibacter sp.]|nr:TolC family protein [Phaeodactylibacter sp.]
FPRRRGPGGGMLHTVQQISYLLLLLLLPLQIIAQQRITSTELLAQRTNDPIKTAHDELLDFATDYPQKLPLIDKLEFRTETDELDWNRQEYLFRLGLNGLREKKAQRLYYESEVELLQARKDKYTYNQLAARFYPIAEWHYADRQLQVLYDQALLLDDQHTYFQNMLANGLAPEVKELLEQDEARFALEQNQLQQEQRKKRAQQFLFPENHTGTPELDTNQWISVAQMQQWVDTALTDVFEHPDYQVQLARQQRAAATYDLERARQAKVLDFVQLRYAGRDNLELPQEFSFGISFNIPTKGTRRVDVAEAALEQQEAAFDQIVLEVELQEALQEALANFQLNLEQYPLLRQFLADNTSEKLLESYRDAGRLSPLDWLRWEEKKLRQQRNLIELEARLCRRYLDLLSLKGQLGAAPYRNYLSAELPEFTPIR